jgi:hypothetical protein
MPALLIRANLALLFFLAPPFWETRPPDQWTDRELATLLSGSPWAQVIGPTPGVLVYFATARPVAEAQAELRRRSHQPPPTPDSDYLSYLDDNRGKQFVLAIPYASLTGLGRADEERRMEKETAMLAGGKTYPMVGHFPPTPSDPVLRLIFPREIRPGDKRVAFRLYLPGIDFPERELDFNVKDLTYHGKLEM